MNGLNLIRWAVQQCVKDNVEPNDANILMRIRSYSNEEARGIVGLKYGDNRYVDHINGDVFDNRPENLRIATRVENKR